MTVWRFVRPVDVLHLRGNRLFGEGAGDHGEALMPPWPSVLAGAIRSRMLAGAGVHLGRFTEETAEPPEELRRAGLAEVLGTPSAPGSFRLAGMTLAVRPEGGDPWPLFPLPADLVVVRRKEAPRDPRPVPPLAELLAGGETPPPDPVEVYRLLPGRRPGAVQAGTPLPLAMVLRREEPAKPASGYWLTAEGLRVYLEGGTPEPGHLVHRRWLWRDDPRTGIAMDDAAGTAGEGRLYTSVAVAPAPGVGFLVGVEGCPAELLPSAGLLRLGGDGRGAAIAPAPDPLAGCPDPGGGGRFALYLLTPGLFPGGWLPPGVDPETLELRAEGIQGRLVAAALARHGVVSGWDVAAHAPKPAQRAVPAGAVYLFGEVTGDPAAYAAGLWDAIEAELGPALDTVWRQRRAEGFGAAVAGAWPAAAGGRSPAGTTNETPGR